MIHRLAGTGAVSWSPHIAPRVVRWRTLPPIVAAAAPPFQPVVAGGSEQASRSSHKAWLRLVAQRWRERREAHELKDHGQEAGTSVRENPPSPLPLSAHGGRLARRVGSTDGLQCWRLMSYGGERRVAVRQRDTLHRRRNHSASAGVQEAVPHSRLGFGDAA